MTLDEVVSELKAKASATTRSTLLKHGAPDSLLGVKVEDLKVIQKKVKTDHKLALALYDTGISDAMYLAGLIADDRAMTRSDLQRWVEAAPWYMISEYTVAWVASGSFHGRELAREWIASDADAIASAGWATWACLVSVVPNESLDLDELSGLLDRVASTIAKARNRTRYAMNGFVIAVGGYIPALTDKALATAESIGKVSVEMGTTACKVPDAAESIQKMVARGHGKKRKTAKC